MSHVPPTPKPVSDVRIEQGQVLALLRAQHPALAELRLDLADEGWDNAIYRRGEDLAVRLPRRQCAHPLLLEEMR